MSAAPAAETRDWEELAAIFSRWVSWHRRRRAVRWSLRGLAISLAAALALFAVLLPLQRVVAREFGGGILVSCMAGLILGGMAGWFWPVERLRQAQRFDRSFGLAERVSTALELHAADALDAQAAAWRQRQLVDALAAARSVEPGRERPFKLERIPLVAVGIIGLMLGGLGYWGGGWFQAAGHVRQVAQAIQGEQVELEKISQEIQASPDLSQAEKDALTQPLKEAMQSLKDARSPEQALATLQQAQDQIRAVGEASDQNQLQALKDAGKMLAGSGSKALAEVGQALEAGDLAKAGQLLAAIDPSQLTDAQRQSLAQALAQAGVTASQDAASSTEALQQAGQAIAQAGQPGAQGRAAQRAAGQIQQGQTALSQAGGLGQQMAANPAGQGTTSSGQGQSGQSGQGNGAPGNQPGQGQGNGQANNSAGQGQGSGGSQANTAGSQGGGGAGRGSANGSSGQGGAAGQQPISQGNGPGDGGESAYEPVYAPERLGGSGGATVDLPGSGQPGRQNLGQGPSAMGNPGESQVPYVDALPSYSEAYRQAMENGEVPGYLIPVVRDYFSSLQP